MFYSTYDLALHQSACYLLAIVFFTASIDSTIYAARKKPSVNFNLFAQ